MFGFVFRLVGRMMAFAAKSILFVGALVVVGAATMYALFDAEQYKRVVTQRLSDATGRIVTIDGPTELHLSFPPRVVLNDVRIRNARWKTRSDMARIRRVEARLNPLRAIAGDSGMTDIRLEGVDLYLETGPGGIGNWEVSSVTGSAAGVAAGTMAVLDSLGLISPAQPASSITLADLSLTFRDGASGRTQVVVLPPSVELPGIGLPIGGGGSGIPIIGGPGSSPGGGSGLVAGGGSGAPASGAAGGGSAVNPAPVTVAGVTDKRDDPCEKDGSLSLR